MAVYISNEGDNLSSDMGDWCDYSLLCWINDVDQLMLMHAVY